MASLFTTLVSISLLSTTSATAVQQRPQTFDLRQHIGPQNIEVTLVPSISKPGIVVKYRLKYPLRMFRLGIMDDTAKTQRWHLISNYLTISNGYIISKKRTLFRNVSIFISPSSIIFDRVYPALFRIGSGWQVYLPYLYVTNYSSKTSFHLPAENSRWTLQRGERKASYVFIGPITYQRFGKFHWVVDPSAEPALFNDITREADASVNLYEKKLEHSLGYRPLVIVGRTKTGKTTWQGDVPAGGGVSIRIFGAPPFPERLAKKVDHFVRHEVFHLWNAGWRQPKRECPDWLPEGMAEYAAVIGGVGVDDLNDREFRLSMEERLSDCLQSAHDSAKSPGLIYGCGTIFEWMTDLAVRQRSGNQKNIFDVWRTLFRSPDIGHGYGIEEYRKAVQEVLGEESPVKHISEPSDVDFISMAIHNLRSLRVSIRFVSDPSDYRSSLISDLMGQVCHGAYGYRELANGEMQLDSKDRCGALNGDPTVIRVAGQDIVKNPSEAFHSFEAQCVSNGRAIVETKGGNQITLPCPKDIPKPAGHMTIEPE